MAYPSSTSTSATTEDIMFSSAMIQAIINIYESKNSEDLARFMTPDAILNLQYLQGQDTDIPAVDVIRCFTQQAGFADDKSALQKAFHQALRMIFPVGDLEDIAKAICENHRELTTEFILSLREQHSNTIVYEFNTDSLIEFLDITKLTDFSKLNKHIESLERINSKKLKNLAGSLVQHSSSVDSTLNKYDNITAREGVSQQFHTLMEEIPLCNSGGVTSVEPTRSTLYATWDRQDDGTHRSEIFTELPQERQTRSSVLSSGFPGFSPASATSSAADSDTDSKDEIFVDETNEQPSPRSPSRK
tara:strand:+ start:51 stop:959 length:909 start_codon:yes stop_codon:yes gene_type:complete